MHPDPPSANGEPGDHPLPPVEAPSARFILQLFLVPGILVALVVAFIWVFFGWIGGPQSPRDFLLGLNSSSDIKRWKTAQDLAQVLPRDPVLRRDVPFALALTAMLEIEMNRPPAKPAAEDETETPDLLEFLPAAVGNFNVPVGLPVLQQLVDRNLDRTDQPEALLRLRNAVVAIGFLGNRMNEYDQLTREEKRQIRDQLAAAAVSAESQKDLIRRAEEYLERREASTNAIDADTYQVVDTLRRGARSGDEMTCKYAILALANWKEPGVEGVLAELAAMTSGLTRFEDRDQERAYREIRYNAALALARRSSPRTPVNLVLETLDPGLLKRHYPANEGMVGQWNLKALHDLGEWKTRDPEGFGRETQILAAVQKLEEGENPAVSVEAQKLLGGTPAQSAAAARFSRQTLLTVSVLTGIGVLLAVGVFARWRRASTHQLAR